MNVTLALLLHQPGSQATAGLEARRRRREVGREGGGCSGQEAEEEEGCYGGAGEGTQLPRSAKQLCHYPPLAGRKAPGVTPERAASRHLLPRMALARPAVTP